MRTICTVPATGAPEAGEAVSNGKTQRQGAGSGKTKSGRMPPGEALDLIAAQDQVECGGAFELLKLAGWSRHGRQRAPEQPDAQSQHDKPDDDEESADARERDVQAKFQREKMKDRGNAEASGDEDEERPEHRKDDRRRIALHDIAEPSAQIGAIGSQLASAGSVGGNRSVECHGYAAFMMFMDKQRPVACRLTGDCRSPRDALIRFGYCGCTVVSFGSTASRRPTLLVAQIFHGHLLDIA